MILIRRRIAAVLAVGLGLLAACGSNDKKGTPASDVTGQGDGAGADTQAPSTDAEWETSDLPAPSDVVGPAPSDAEGADPSDSSDSSDWSAPSDPSDSSDVPAPVNCGLNYQFEPYDPGPLPAMLPPALPWNREGVEMGKDWIAWLDPDPPGHEKLSVEGREDIVLPSYQDDMPLFERAAKWTEPYRCYELPSGGQYLSEDEAWYLYRDIAERTTGHPMDVTPGVRTVVGIRGAYPGTFAWNGNAPNLFNDTLVLLWSDDQGTRHVREFPVNTDTGAYDFGFHSSSSLRPNRVYPYRNGWHKTYNALHIDEESYQVRDDANKNGHWDSDRNGWYPPQTDPDHDRTGAGHNIHMASVDAPLGYAHVDNWSAGCQTIPGIENWKEFIARAWTGMGDPVSYFLVDARDIDPEVWNACAAQIGTRECPFRIKSFPFSDARNTADSSSWEFPLYNCSPANEAGPEYFYVLNLEQAATIHVKVDDIVGVGQDIDVHLLDGDSPLACLARDDVEFFIWVPPGRYWMVADTYFEGGVPLVGAYVLDVWLE